MLVTFKSLESNAQVAFLLGVSETIVELLSTSLEYEDVTNALKVCWEWLENKRYSGDEIYYLLDDGTEFSGLFMQMQNENDPLWELVWSCIVDAVSFTDWKAYQYRGEKYLPAPIENVDEDLVQQFLDSFYRIKDTNKDMATNYISYLTTSDTLKKEDIMHFLFTR
ncbi:Imm6 family immunity protein [Bacillus sp. DX1.1]|uniref:Imm6 family immunity protein n=1 Tax=unclassified Bacillus (in: firmicutes) TaxID=185979 RepID=UPI002570EC2E|nr:MULTISPECIES: Imm6 family immunity protein [unclassified Bacillus (in: firmicutes)]MDM5155435.1 Imm6 family immunity protein [Bacillus sp. DX1.1]WJE79748.1 Imm6 family immunity protein [Bacillus sp. DX3.1]